MRLNYHNSFFSTKKKVANHKQPNKFFFFWMVGLIIFFISHNPVFGQKDCVWGSGITITWSGVKVFNVDTIISPLDVLNILPGTIVKFLNPDSRLIVYGTLTAIGTQAQPILFCSDVTNTDGWGGIELTGNRTAQFNYCDFSGIDRGVSLTTGDSFNNGGIKIHQRPNVAFENCTYSNNKGGILVYNSSGILIQNCVFENDTIEGDFHGLLFFFNSTASTIRNCLFNKNKTNLDGLISINSGSHVIVQYNRFTKTSYFESTSSEVTNRGYSIIYSGTPDIYPVTVALTNNVFQNNFGNPGNSDLDLRDICLIGNPVNIELNTAMILNNVHIGSPFLNDPKTAVFAKYSTLSVNYCKVNFYTKSVINLDFCKATIINNFFEHNEIAESTIRIGTYHGYVGSKANIVIDANIISKNRTKTTGTSKGAAIWSSMLENPQCSTLIINNNFFNNSTPGKNGMGGAIFIENSGYLLIDNNTFDKNFSGNVGGSVCLINTSTMVELKNNLFKYDSTFLHGGAIYIEGDGDNQNEQILIRKNDFYMNTAGSYGGGVFVMNSNIVVDSNSFTQNKAFEGGGMFAENIVNSELNDNIFRENRSDIGGGFYFKDCNKSITNDAERSNDIFLKRNVFTENFYRSMGGGGFIENCDSVNFYENLFYHNHKENLASNSSGGGIYVLNSNPGFYNSMFMSNEADLNKGSLCFDIGISNTLDFHNCNVVDNHFEGGMFFKNKITTDNIRIYNSLFWGLGLEYQNYGSKAIMYSFSNAIHTNYCYFDRLPLAFNVTNNSYKQALFPGWLSPDYLLDCAVSICANNGSNDPKYNDNTIPPTPYCPDERNDIGITGGPFATMNNPSIDATKFTRIKPAFNVEILSFESKTINIVDESVIDIQSNENLKYQLFFGDGNKTDVLSYSKNLSFTHTFEKDIDEVDILLIITNSNDRFFFHQTVTFEQLTTDVIESTQNVSTNDQSLMGFVNPGSYDEAVTIYPNPTTGVLTLQLNANLKDPIQVLVFNLHGHLVYSTENIEVRDKTHIIDLSDKSKGVYFIKVKNDQHDVFTSKVLIY